MFEFEKVFLYTTVTLKNHDCSLKCFVVKTKKLLTFYF